MSDMNPPIPQYPPPPQFPLNTVMTPNGPMVAMAFGQILERIFKLLRANLRAFLGIGMLPVAALFGFYGVVAAVLFATGFLPHPPAHPNPSTMFWTFVPAYLLFLPFFVFFYGLYYGASTYAAVQTDQGLKVTTVEAFRHGWSRVGRYTWLIVLRSLMIILPLFVIVAVAGVIILLLGLSRNMNANLGVLFVLIPLAFLCYLGFLVYAILMTLRFSLAFPACTHEGLTAWQSIKRSGLLTNGAKGRIFLVLLIIYAISCAAIMVLYMIAFFVFGIVAAVAGDKLQDPSPLTIAFLVIGGLIALALVLLWSAVLMGAYSLTFAVFYRDQLLRKEGVLPAPLPMPGGASA